MVSSISKEGVELPVIVIDFHDYNNVTLSAQRKKKFDFAFDLELYSICCSTKDVNKKKMTATTDKI